MQYIGILIITVVVALFALPACRTVADVSVHSQNAQFGNQSIELHRAMDTGNGTAQ